MMIQKNRVILGILLVSQLLQVSTKCEAEQHESAFKIDYSALEDALLELERAADAFDVVSKLLREPHLKNSRSQDSFEEDLTAASNAVTNAIDSCVHIIEKQKQMGHVIKTVLNENVEKQALLQQKVASLEKEQSVQIELGKRLFSLLDQMLAQLKIYSDYMQTLDAGICELIAQQNEINQCITAPNGVTVSY